MLGVLYVVFVVFFKQKTAYEMRISDWSSDVCSSDLVESGAARFVACLWELERASAAVVGSAGTRGLSGQCHRPAQRAADRRGGGGGAADGRRSGVAAACRGHLRRAGAGRDAGVAIAAPRPRLCADLDRRGGGARGGGGGGAAGGGGDGVGAACRGRLRRAGAGRDAGVAIAAPRQRLCADLDRRGGGARRAVRAAARAGDGRGRWARLAGRLSL